MDCNEGAIVCLGYTLQDSPHLRFMTLRRCIFDLKELCFINNGRMKLSSAVATVLIAGMCSIAYSAVESPRVEVDSCNHRIS